MMASSQIRPAERHDAETIPLPRPLKEKIRDGIVAMSLANLCFVTAWFNTLYDKDSYYNKLPVTSLTLLALLANICWSSIFIWLIIRLARHFQNRILRMIFDLCFAGLVLIPLNFIRYGILQIWDYQVLQFFKQPAVILFAVVMLALVLWKHRWAAGTVRFVAACLSPLAFFTLGKTFLLLLGVMHLQQQIVAPSLPSPGPVQAGQPRVVWIIFDSADYQWIYESRPPGVELPEFDQLRGESLCALNAVTPGNTTVGSMPALISGRQISRENPDALSDLTVTLTDTGQTTTWKKLPSVFAEARALGVNTALVGWYHPYDRVLGDGLNYCSWYPFPAFEPDRDRTFSGSLRQQIGCIIFTPHVRHIYLSICQKSLQDSLGVVTNRAYGLILLHLPPPHTPGVYLPKEKRFTFWPMTRVTGYQNNLALADLELGQIRRTMEAAGVWEKDWVIVSADHSRQQVVSDEALIDHRVPFAIKTPGHNEQLSYTPKINTVLTHDLVLSILHSEVTNQSSLVTWLDANGKPLPTAVQAPE
jgi:hypothetical protein